MSGVKLSRRQDARREFAIASPSQVLSDATKFGLQVLQVELGSRASKLGDQLLVVIQGQEVIVNRVWGWPDGSLARARMGTSIELSTGRNWKGRWITTMCPLMEGLSPLVFGSPGSPWRIIVPFMMFDPAGMIWPNQLVQAPVSAMPANGREKGQSTRYIFPPE